jgi:Leucine-rich repeat (LRR) protein
MGQEHARSSKKRWIPADLVQNTAEYLGRVAGFLAFRGVSIAWQGAVSDAVGFLNGRCWTRLRFYSPLLVTLCRHDGAAGDRCVLLCLGPRLETLADHFPFPSGLLGEENNALTTLTLRHGTTDVRGLKNCRALKTLRFASDSVRDASVTDADIRGLELIPALEDIEVQRCSHVTNVSCLRDSRTLKKLSLRYTGVTDAGIRGLELIPTLEDLNLTGTRVTDVSCLRDSRALKKLNLSSTGVTDAGIRGLELIPTLEDINLDGCTSVTDVSCLRNSRALKKLNLICTGVTNAGIRGLELIPTLVVLQLQSCNQVHDLSALRNRSSLRIL